MTLLVLWEGLFLYDGRRALMGTLSKFGVCDKVGPASTPPTSLFFQPSETHRTFSHAV
jgi:hypothetical protein